MKKLSRNQNLPQMLFTVYIAFPKELVWFLKSPENNIRNILTQNLFFQTGKDHTR